jgi:predicted DNA-binding ribbon-helix-helix protein
MSVKGRKYAEPGLERHQCAIHLEEPLWRSIDTLADDLGFSVNCLVNEAVAEWLDGVYGRKKSGSTRSD